jgi:hypothetical protein
MATLVLSAAGAAVGSGLAGSFGGMTAMALGRAAGATIGSMIDQRLLGEGSRTVETARVDRLRVMGSTEGAGLPRCFGRSRVAGQVIWASRFLEAVGTQRVGGKGTRQTQTVRQYSYSVSLAVALCEGVVHRIGRIWADGQPLVQEGINWRLHAGNEDQMPDPLIAAVEGGESAPAYRGTAYVVFEDLDLGQFGNRIPQFNFEVFRRAEPARSDLPRAAALEVRGIALVPGTGEYALSDKPVAVTRGRGDTEYVNIHNDCGLPDFTVSLDQMQAELPNCDAVSLVVSWFGDDLRIDRCSLFPAVEQGERDADGYPWVVSGATRKQARVVSQLDGRPLFGGTPADRSVVESIRAMKARGLSVMFYPFILMDILPENGLQNPWTLQGEQPPVPWRGRMTLSRAPGVPDSPDMTSGAEAEVAAFFGQAIVQDFWLRDGRVLYSGPEEWSYRRFILHYAHLCSLAGGVDAFCIGSEMRSLTQIRSGPASFPAVDAFCRLVEDVRAVLGPAVKISYAADWSEYFGYQPADGSGDVLFHLDSLWAHPDVNFIGIDNYMPLSDWRDEPGHLDEGAGSIYSLEYLRSNVCGGEGYHWYYPDSASRDRQERAPIEDGAFGEPWTFRYKDVEGWWSNVHVNRVGGVKVALPTAWQPGSKPIWFTELGCPAVDKGTNQPNVFYDPKSSESFLPYYSTGRRDDYIQRRYLQAVYSHWRDPGNNPASPLYGGRMVDLRRAFVWAWDARPWPDFPARLDVWVDGGNYARGHWLNGRIGTPSLAEVVADICGRAGFSVYDVAKLRGTVTGFQLSGIETVRQSLQPLMLGFAFDASSSGDEVAFRHRGDSRPAGVTSRQMVLQGGEPPFTRTRSSAAELVKRVSINFVRADNDYQPGAVTAAANGAVEPSTAEATLPIAFSVQEAQRVANRWLHETASAQEAVTLNLAPSTLALTAGDAITLMGRGTGETFRIDRIDDRGVRAVTALRYDAAVYDQPQVEEVPLRRRVPRLLGPVDAEFLDLPRLAGSEDSFGPHLAVAANVWPGQVAVYASSGDAGFSLCGLVERPAVTGVLQDPLPGGGSGLWMRNSVRVRLDQGALERRSRLEVLNGANLAAIRLGASAEPEIIQFAHAELIAPLTYRLSDLLRGQAGTDSLMPTIWPIGTDFILLDDAVRSLDLPLSVRGLVRQFRVGPAQRAYTEGSYREYAVAFAGVALRPYAPVHIRATRLTDGSIDVRWIRRTRIDGDSWQGRDVPIGEERLLFEIRVRSGQTLLRTATSTSARFVYSIKDQSIDGATGTLYFDIAQVSEPFGPGPFGRTTING